MLSTRVIPCLDVHNGRTVKGINFNDLVDAGDPVELAMLYNKLGADELCFLDISATNEKRRTMYKMVSKVSEKCFIPLTVGGGVKEILDFKYLLKSGADKVSVNSAALKDPLLIKKAADNYGSQCVVLAIDALENKSMPSGYEVTTHGGRKQTSIDVLKWAKKGVKNGAGEILLTSMNSDGTKKGYNLELTKLISQSVSVPVIASGGAGNPKDMVEVVLNSGASAVLAASIFHFGTFSIKEAKEYLKSKNVSVRI